MWYFRKVASPYYEQFGAVSICLYPKYIKFCFQNLRIAIENKNGLRLLLALIMKNNFLLW